MTTPLVYITDTKQYGIKFEVITSSQTKLQLQNCFFFFFFQFLDLKTIQVHASVEN